jgi:hypothetical protein
MAAGIPVSAELTLEPYALGPPDLHVLMRVLAAKPARPAKPAKDISPHIGQRQRPLD